MTWRRSIRAAILGLVVIGLAGIWARTPRPLDARMEPRRLLTPWRTDLDELERALATGDHARAMRAWSDAETAALASRRWEPLLEVGDAALRVGDGTGSPARARLSARHAYRAALFRARAQRSVDGVLRAADAFARLGDRDVTEGALHAARKLAAGTPDADLRSRVELDAARIAARVGAE
jgi:hypothetical protein